MKKSLISGLTEEQAEEISRDFVASAFLRKRLSDILTQKISSKRSESTSKASYDSPSWAYYQADAIGYERALNEVISLLSNEADKK